MRKKINFTKMVASGNDFVIVKDQKLPSLAKQICDRKYGIGADGLLILEKSKIADIKMRIFNPDGSEAEMCGNGARCAALYSARNQKLPPKVDLPMAEVISNQKKINIETRAGIIESQVEGENVKIKFNEPKDIKLEIPVKISNRLLRVNFINTGVPHTVIFVECVDRIDVVNLGRKFRYHQRFQPQGTNVDFVEILNKNSIKMRTYERGVEGETLSCGTGAVASAIMMIVKLPNCQTAKYKINVHTKSGEILKVYFDRINNKSFKNIWLEGKARIIFKGEFII